MYTEHPANFPLGEMHDSGVEETEYNVPKGQGHCIMAFQTFQQNSPKLSKRNSKNIKDQGQIQPNQPVAFHNAGFVIDESRQRLYKKKSSKSFSKNKKLKDKAADAADVEKSPKHYEDFIVLNANSNASPPEEDIDTEYCLPIQDRPIQDRPIQDGPIQDRPVSKRDSLYNRRSQVSPETMVRSENIVQPPACDSPPLPPPRPKLKSSLVLQDDTVEPYAKVKKEGKDKKKEDDDIPSFQDSEPKIPLAPVNSLSSAHNEGDTLMLRPPLRRKRPNKRPKSSEGGEGEPDVYDGTRDYEDLDLNPGFYRNSSKRSRIRRNTKVTAMQPDPEDTRYWITVESDC